MRLHEDVDEEHNNQPQFSTYKGGIIHRRRSTLSITVNCRLFSLPLIVTFVRHFFCHRCSLPSCAAVIQCHPSSSLSLFVIVVRRSLSSHPTIIRHQPSSSSLLFVAVVCRRHSPPSYATGLQYSRYCLSPSFTICDIP